MILLSSVIQNNNVISILFIDAIHGKEVYHTSVYNKILLIDQKDI